jgi:Hg(II)-responsive transcriptional regulator
MQHFLTIGKLAQKSDVSIDSIRFYERRGLLELPTRTEANYRVYPAKTVDRIRFIKQTQKLGFSLNEIQELLELQHNPDASKADVKWRTEEKIKDIRSRIHDLRRMLRVLEQLDASCDGHGPIGECPILEALATDDGDDCHHSMTKG